MAGALKLPDVIAPLTANGTSTGVVTVAASNVFTIGAKCNLFDVNGLSLRVVITGAPTATTLTVRKDFDLSTVLTVNYGNTDISAFLLANSAKIEQLRQLLVIDYTEVTTPQNII